MRDRGGELADARDLRGARQLQLHVAQGLRGSFELGPGETQRLESLHLFGIAHRPAARLGPLALELFHPFLDSRISIDQTFAGITHLVPFVRG